MAEWVPDQGGWGIPGFPGQKCRRLRCPNPTAASIQVPHKQTGRFDLGYRMVSYCADHLLELDPPRRVVIDLRDDGDRPTLYRLQP